MEKKTFSWVMAGAVFVFLALASCGGKANPETDFERYANDRGGIVIKGYVGQSKTVVIPRRLDGKPVIVLNGAFFNSQNHP